MDVLKLTHKLSARLNEDAPFNFYVKTAAIQILIFTKRNILLTCSVSNALMKSSTVSAKRLVNPLHSHPTGSPLVLTENRLPLAYVKSNKLVFGVKGSCRDEMERQAVPRELFIDVENRPALVARVESIKSPLLVKGFGHHTKLISQNKTSIMVKTENRTT